MSLRVFPGDFAGGTIVKEPLETVLFLHKTRAYAALASRTSNGVGYSNNQNGTRRHPRKKADAGTGITADPKAKANPGCQNRKSGEMKPSWQLWVSFDGVISPFLVLVGIASVVLGFEDDSFHITTRNA